MLIYFYVSMLKHIQLFKEIKVTRQENQVCLDIYMLVYFIKIRERLLI